MYDEEFDVEQAIHNLLANETDIIDEDMWVK